MSEVTSFPKSQIKVLLLENIHASGVDLLKQQGFQVESVSQAYDEQELIKKAADVHVLGIRSKTQLSAAYFQHAKRLLTVGCFCIGTNQVNLDAAKRLGAPVFNAPFSNTRSVAELVLAEIVMLARRAAERSQWLHQGRWEKSAQQCVEVRGKTLGIVGYGHIGSQVSVLAESFGMQVLFYDVVTKMPMGNSRPVESLSDLLARSDFVTLHVPETPSTKGMIGAQELKAMKKGSYLLNASRGSVVDLDALRRVLDERHLAGAAVDVYPVEPESNGEGFRSVLQGAPNTILTPHIGGSTEEAQRNIGIEVAQSLIKFINNGSTMGAVNFPAVDLPLLRGSHRILNVHKNVPGVLRNINTLISDLGANIEGQYLATDPEIGYLIIDIDRKVSDQVKDSIAALSTSLRTRILY